MIHNALHILGPVSALYLDPFLLADSQPKGIVGYVLICLDDPGVSGKHDMLCFDGEEWVVCVRLTPEGRSFIGVDIARSEYSLRNKGSVMVHLFTIDSSLMERFLTTVRNEPCFKIRIETLRRRQVEMLVRTYGSHEVLAERNDFVAAPPRMEFQPMLPGQPLPAFAMGFGRGEFLLYRCPEAERAPASATIPDELSGDPEADQPFAHQSRILVSRRRLVGAGKRSPCPASLPAEPLPGPENIQPGAHVTAAGTFVDVARDAPIPGLTRAKRMGKPIEPSDQLEFLPGSKVTGNTASSATVSPKRSAQVQENAPVPEIVNLLQQLVDEFRRQAMSILGSKGVLVFESCERQLRKHMPLFKSDEIDNETAVLAVDLIDAVVRAAPLLKRSKLRSVTLALIADLYNKHFEELNRHGFIPRVEEVYFTHKKRG